MQQGPIWVRDFKVVQVSMQITAALPKRLAQSNDGTTLRHTLEGCCEGIMRCFVKPLRKCLTQLALGQYYYIETF
jgi:hypothetical protein